MASVQLSHTQNCIPSLFLAARESWKLTVLVWFVYIKTKGGERLLGGKLLVSASISLQLVFHKQVIVIGPKMRIFFQSLGKKNPSITLVILLIIDKNQIYLLQHLSPLLIWPLFCTPSLSHHILLPSFDALMHLKCSQYYLYICLHDFLCGEHCFLHFHLDKSYLFIGVLIK